MLQDLKDMMDMLFGGTGENKVVIQVDEDEVVEHVSQHVINEWLENCGSIGESGWHNQILEVT